MSVSDWVMHISGDSLFEGTLTVVLGSVAAIFAGVRWLASHVLRKVEAAEQAAEKQAQVMEKRVETLEKEMVECKAEFSSFARLEKHLDTQMMQLNARLDELYRLITSLLQRRKDDMQ